MGYRNLPLGGHWGRPQAESGAELQGGLEWLLWRCQLMAIIHWLPQVHSSRGPARTSDVSPLQVNAPCALPTCWVCTSLTISSFQQEIFPYIPLDMLLTRAPGHTFMGVASSLLDTFSSRPPSSPEPPAQQQLPSYQAND